MRNILAELAEWLERIFRRILQLLRSTRLCAPPPPAIDVCSYPSFAAAIMAIGAAERTLVISSLVPVTTTVTVPRNVTLSFTEGGQLVIADGVRLIISGGLLAPPRMIFRLDGTGTGTVVFGSGLLPRVYPHWWGADDQNSSTNAATTTTAIRAALASLYTISGQPPGAEYVGSSQAVEFLAGWYVINDEIPAGTYANVVSEAKAVIIQTNPSAGILVLNNAYTVHVSGIKFVGGTIQVFLANNNTDTSTFAIDHCEFHLATTCAIVAVPQSPADHLSALLTIDDCKFVWPRAVLKNYCDVAVFQDSWVTAPGPGAPDDYAMFINASGALYLKNMVGVPGLGDGGVNSPRAARVRWIDNHGDVFVDHTRFGGENAGMPIVYNFASPPPSATGYPWLGPTIAIRNSYVYDGPAGYPDTAVVNLVTGVPETILYEGNTGPAEGPIVVNGGALNLAAYFAAYPQSKFRVLLEPNANSGLDRVPQEMVPYVNFLEENSVADLPPTSGAWVLGQRLEARTPQLFGPAGYLCYGAGTPGSWVEYGGTSPFPIGARPGVTISASAAMFTYTLPPTLSGFVAIVTVSVNPNVSGSGGYRTAASYLISLTTGYDGVQVVNVLSSSLLFQPPTPQVARPSLISLHFGSGDMGSSQRPLASGGTFTVVWDNTSQPGQTFVSIHVLHAFA